MTDELPIVASLAELRGHLVEGDFYDDYDRASAQCRIPTEAAAVIGELVEALEYVRAATPEPIPIGRRHWIRRIDAALAKVRSHG